MGRGSKKRTGEAALKGLRERGKEASFIKKGGKRNKAVLIRPPELGEARREGKG